MPSQVAGEFLVVALGVEVVALSELTTELVHESGQPRNRSPAPNLIVRALEPGLEFKAQVNTQGAALVALRSRQVLVDRTPLFRRGLGRAPVLDHVELQNVAVQVRGKRLRRCQDGIEHGRPIRKRGATRERSRNGNTTCTD